MLTTADRARDLRLRPVYVIGGERDHLGQTYDQVPAWDYTVPEMDGEPAGYVGRLAARRAFAMGGVTRDDVSVFEFYDPFSFEIIRQFEAFGFCKEGEGGEFVMGGTIEVGGKYPIVTDGGTMSFSHTGPIVQMMQRVARGGTALDPDVVAQLVSRGGDDGPLSELTPREREVLGLMAEGRSNQAIADALVVTPRAIEKHITNIFEKLGLGSAVEDHRRVLAVLTFLRAS